MHGENLKLMSSAMFKKIIIKRSEVWKTGYVLLGLIGGYWCCRVICYHILYLKERSCQFSFQMLVPVPYYTPEHHNLNKTWSVCINLTLGHVHITNLCCRIAAIITYSECIISGFSINGGQQKECRRWVNGRQVQDTRIETSTNLGNVISVQSRVLCDSPRTSDRRYDVHPLQLQQYCF